MTEASNKARQDEYDTVAWRLRTLAEMRDEHKRLGCTSGPMCPGGDARDVLEGGLRQGDAAMFLLTAVGEIGRLEAENTRLAADLLDAQGRLADWDACAGMLAVTAKVVDGE